MYVLFAVIGLVVGSLIGVVAYRMPRHQSFILGHSFSDCCQKQLRWFDLIPVVSFCVLLGKCRTCRQRITPRYPFIELLTSALFLICIYRTNTLMQGILYCLFTAVLIVIALIDYDTMIIYDSFHMCILILSFLHAQYITNPTFHIFTGMIAISIPLFLIASITGGLGYGDVKLMAVSGCFLGPLNIWLAFVIGTLSAAVVTISMFIRKKGSLKQEIPFGPYLCFGIFVSLCFSQELFSVYFLLY